MSENLKKEKSLKVPFSIPEIEGRPEEEILAKIVGEYPLVGEYQPTVIKQFRSGDGRVYNVFLIHINGERFDFFVAKGVANEKTDIKLEWLILKMLQDSKAFVPVLLIPEVQPENYMLVDFIEGQTAREAIEGGADKGEIFSKIGEALQTIHSVEAPKFGDLIEDNSQQWIDTVQQAFTKKMTNSADEVGADILEKSIAFFNERKHLLEADGQADPIIMHRDIYMENFILEKDTDYIFMIDFGLGKGGRPLFDLAKFYIWDMYEDSDQQANFLKTYSLYNPKDSEQVELLSLYILVELFGMIAYFKNSDKELANHARGVLIDLLAGEGHITDVLHAFLQQEQNG